MLGAIFVFFLFLWISSTATETPVAPSESPKPISKQDFSAFGEIPAAASPAINRKAEAPTSAIQTKPESLTNASVIDPMRMAQLEQNQARMRETSLIPMRLLMEGLGFDKTVNQRALDVMSEYQAQIDKQMISTLATGKPPEMTSIADQDRLRDEKLRSVMGDQNFAEFQSNLKTIPERMAVSGLELQMQNAGVAFTEQQASQLLDDLLQASAGAPQDIKARSESINTALSQSSALASPQQKAVVEKFLEDVKRKQASMPSRGAPPVR